MRHVFDKEIIEANKNRKEKIEFNINEDRTRLSSVSALFIKNGRNVRELFIDKADEINNYHVLRNPNYYFLLIQKITLIIAILISCASVYITKKNYELSKATSIKQDTLELQTKDLQALKLQVQSIEFQLTKSDTRQKK